MSEPVGLGNGLPLPNVNLLVVDDDSAALEALRTLLSFDYSVIAASSGLEAIEAVRAVNDIAAVIMDIRMPKMDGITAAREIRAINPDTLIIFHTAYPGDFNQDQIDASERPFAYVEKAGPISVLTRSVRNAVELHCLRRDSDSLIAMARASFGLIGGSQPMRSVFELMYKVARTDYKVMIRGETGTGKELVARAIHACSLRRDKPFVTIDCNHKSPDLAESELFGHVKGAFTGAIADRVGKFEAAGDGTVLLDEIGDLDCETQMKLLRVLESREYSRVGESSIRISRARVICATNRNLERLMDEEKFRKDLYFRLKGLTIELPPLRERRDDIPLLAEHFLRRETIEQGFPPRLIDPQAMSVLINHAWPGNVRQLEDTIKTSLVMVDSGVILEEDIRRVMEVGGESRTPEFNGGGLAAETRDFRRNRIIQALANHNGNRSAVARELKLDPANLRRLMREYNIQGD